MSNHDPLELENFLPYRLSILSNAVSAGIASEYEERFHLSMTQWRVLAILARYPDSSAREVAELSLLDKVAVSRALAHLVAAGHVHRTTHNHDHRRSVLRLNASGWRIHDTVAPLARERERALLAQLSAEERKMLKRIVDKLLPTLDGARTGQVNHAAAPTSLIP